MVKSGGELGLGASAELSAFPPVWRLSVLFSPSHNELLLVKESIGYGHSRPMSGFSKASVSLGLPVGVLTEILGRDNVDSGPPLAMVTLRMMGCAM